MSDDPRNCPICGHGYTKCTCAPEHRVRLTDTDDAKLLPCPKGEIPADRWNELSAAIVEAAKTWKDTSEDRAAMMLFSHRDSVIRFIWPIIQRWNTRPQPAPTAGEPDFDIMNGELEQEFYRTGGDRTHGYIRRYLVTRAYRLGLAVRPKVEDAK